MHIKQQNTCPRYIYKIHSERLRKARWRLNLPLVEARKNDEIIALADSQVLRWLDELNGIEDADERAREIRREIRRLRKADNTAENRREIKKLYQKLDAIQFKPDYMCLIIDKEKDYWRACEGFSINGLEYRRLLGTNGGIKNSTIVFISARHIEEIRRRIDNGRNLNQKLVPAKLEAYKALACSASIPVSWPKGILVVKDFETVFHEDTIYLTDENDGEPIMEEHPDTEIHLDGSDGFGMMLPSLAERWSEELGLDYVMSGCNTRLSFEKGMIFTFDFVDFAEKVAGTYEVQDVWGEVHDIREIELVFTESMLKLWDGYASIEQYLECCHENGYTVCVTKVTPKQLENQRTLNYQFIQSYRLTDDEIEELIRPTVDEIQGVLGMDWAKTVLFLAGAGVGQSNLEAMKPGLAKAIMADRQVLEDPFVRGSVYQLIRNRINEAKVGVLNVHGNYSIVSGDPYGLCQSMFGMEVTGILKAGELYNRYWADCSAEKAAAEHGTDGIAADEVVCFRAPMSVHNNIRRMRVCQSDEAMYWYRYNTTGTILNCWDTTTAALNGMDFDGDLVMLTDNPVLVKNCRQLPTIMCIQRKAAKVVPSVEETIRSNIAAFGDEIGKTTNWITSMYEVQAGFKPGSPEFEELEYRTKVGQLIQQNVIDKAKGIVAKPMERTWHDRHAVNQIEDEEKQRFYRSIVADRKPYFMRYIYPDLMKDYRNYIRKTDGAALREFKMTVEELRSLPYSELTDRQKDFLRYYDLGMPVGMGDCVMNRICRRFEEEFDGYVGKFSDTADFDPAVLKGDAEYKQHQYYTLKKLYSEYTSKQRRFVLYAKANVVEEDEIVASMNALFQEFVRQCHEVCQNDTALCNIMVDLLYRKSATKRLLWMMCGETIIENLLDKNGRVMAVPVQVRGGEIEYGGEQYTIDYRTIDSVEDVYEYYSE